MFKQKNSWLALIFVVSLLSGCASVHSRPEPRSVEPVAAPVQVVQVPAGPSPEEVAKMKQQMSDQQAALAQAEADKRALEEKLNEALASKKPAVKKTEDSYLK